MARGPAYPFISLEQAVGLTRKLYDFAKRSPANLEAVLTQTWEYSPTSSSANKAVAAVKYFGLVDIIPGDKGDAIKITDRAYRILVDSPESSERKQALKDSFLSPKAYRLCWDRWGLEMPQSMRSSLIFDEGFIDTTVDGFLANYKRSLQFAGMDASDSDKQPANPAAEHTGDKNGGGIQSTPTPAPHAFAGAANTAGAVARLSTVTPPKGAGMRQEVFALAEGDITIQWPEQLSPDSFQDFTDWLEILQRKIKRSVTVPAQQPAGGRRHLDLSDGADAEDL